MDGDVFGLTPTELPQTMAPELWRQVPPEHLSDPTMDVLGGVHRDALQTLAGILHTHRDVMADPTQTPAANLQRSHQHARKLAGQLLDKMERAEMRTLETIKSIDEATSRVPDPPSDAVARMVYDSFARMTPAQRSETIAWAIDTDDRATLGAVLVQGPAYLWGVSEAEREMHRDRYKRLRYPQALARREALERGLEITSAATRTLSERVASMYDQAALREAETLAMQARKRLEAV